MNAALQAYIDAALARQRAQITAQREIGQRQELMTCLSIRCVQWGLQAFLEACQVRWQDATYDLQQSRISVPITIDGHEGLLEETWYPEWSLVVRVPGLLTRCITGPMTMADLGDMLLSLQQARMEPNPF